MERQPGERDPGHSAGGRPPRATLVVGAGASAGGLQPLEELLARLSPGAGLALVVVQHLDPNHPSMLVDLLGSRTSLRVEEARDGVAPEPDHVYVVAPATVLTLEGGVFRVVPAGHAATDTPIDAFFRSLAADRGERSVGVLFSGAGHDGTAGLRAIRERGGWTLVQSPGTAKHESMPQSAIEAGLVDEVLPPDRIAAALVEHARFVAGAGEADAATLESRIAAARGRICAILQQRTGHDFGSYKEGTLHRRIRRRMQVQRVSSVDRYVRLLEGDRNEAEALLKDLLIGVTEFFRDPDAFQALAQQVIPLVVQGKPPEAAIRAWAPGCASGEEAYSLAMLVREHLDRAQAQRFVQIFATDLDADMLAVARRGLYPADIAERVSPERLARFFVREAGGYQAGKELREMCVFSQHSLVRDAPFSQLDLVSCRNVLIYFGAELQNRIVPLFHYALRPGGFLFLGPSEGLAGGADLFEVVDKRHRIFRRREQVNRPAVDFPLGRRAAPAAAAAPAPRDAAATPRGRVGAAFERALLQEYTSPAAVVDERGEALFLAGSISRHLQLPTGRAAAPNLLESLRGNLRHELRTALRAAVRERRKVVRPPIVVEGDGPRRSVSVVVRPLSRIENEAGLYMVVLQETEAAEPRASAAGEADAAIVEQLEDELRATRGQLKNTIEEVESANEELKSSNEELISTNEELQSANEELHTSKEELQSLNEELETVNAELRQKIALLGAAHADLQNLFAATRIATLFLDRALHVVKFTPAAASVFRVREADVGRPLADLAPRLRGEDLVADAREVLRSLEPIERHVRSLEGDAIYVARILPYRTVENTVAGVVLALVDVTRLHRAEEEVHRNALLLHIAQEAILVWRLDGGIEYWNRGAAELYGWPADEAIGRRSHALLRTVFPRPLEEIEAELRTRGSWTGELLHETRDGRRVTVLASWQLVPGDDGAALVFESNRDITERKRSEEEIQGRERLLRDVIDGSPDLIVFLKDREGRFLTVNRYLERLLGRTRDELRGKTDHDLFAPDIAETYRAHDRTVLETGRAIVLEEEAHLSDGRHIFLASKFPLRDSTGRIYGVGGVSHDITDRKRGEEALRASEQQLREADRRKNDFMAVLSHELRNPLAPITSSLDILRHVDPGDERAGRAQAVIARQVEQLTHLVDDLLDVTRITRSKIQLQRRRLELNDLVRHTVDDHRADFAKAGVRIDLEPAPAPVPVDGDANRLAQVIGNLLQNAAKFTPRGGGTTVSVSVDAPARRAVVRVSDTGVGMAPEVLGRLFQPFMQADASLDRSQGGLGLGLALVKGLVELHGGDIAARSAGLGHGAEFVVRLPLASPEGAVAENAPARPAPARRRVLVIEDNVDAADTLRDVLELEGHEVEVAYDAPQGVARARALVPDVVLCDIGLPEMDGYEVARAFRADDALARTYLVAVSGYAREEDLERARAAGFDRHLAKPPSVDKIREILAAIPPRPDAGGP